MIALLSPPHLSVRSLYDLFSMSMRSRYRLFTMHQHPFGDIFTIFLNIFTISVQSYYNLFTISLPYFYNIFAISSPSLHSLFKKFCTISFRSPYTISQFLYDLFTICFQCLYDLYFVISLISLFSDLFPISLISPYIFYTSSFKAPSNLFTISIYDNFQLS